MAGSVAPGGLATIALIPEMQASLVQMRNQDRAAGIAEREIALRESLAPSEIAQRMAQTDYTKSRSALDSRGMDIQERGQDIQMTLGLMSNAIQQAQLDLTSRRIEAQNRQDNAAASRLEQEAQLLQRTPELAKQLTGDIQRDLPVLMQIHPAAASSYISSQLGGENSAKVQWVRYVAKATGLTEAQIIQSMLVDPEDKFVDGIIKAVAASGFAATPEMAQKMVQNMLAIRNEVLMPKGPALGPPRQGETVEVPAIKTYDPKAGGFK